MTLILTSEKCNGFSGNLDLEYILPPSKISISKGNNFCFVLLVTIAPLLPLYPFHFIPSTFSFLLSACLFHTLHRSQSSHQRRTLVLCRLTPKSYCFCWSKLCRCSSAVVLTNWLPPAAQTWLMISAQYQDQVRYVPCL